MKQLKDGRRIEQEKEQTRASRKRLVDILNRIRDRNDAARACCNGKQDARSPVVPEEELKTKVNIFPRPKKQGQILDLFKSTKQQPDRTRVTLLLFFVWFIQKLHVLWCYLYLSYNPFDTKVIQQKI